MEIHLTNFSDPAFLAVDMGRVLPGCGILFLHEVKRPDPASGMRNCAPKITEGELYIISLLFL